MQAHRSMFKMNKFLKNKVHRNTLPLDMDQEMQEDELAPL